MRRDINEDKFLYDVSEESILKAWDKNTHEHEFSEDYKKFRQELIGQAAAVKKSATEETAEIVAIEKNRPKKRKFFKTPVGAAAAIAAVIVLSVGAYAISGLFTVKSKEYTDENQGEYTYTFDGQAGVEITPMKLVMDYIPEGYVEMENGGDGQTVRKFHKEDGSSGLSLFITDYSRSLSLPFVSDVDETEMNGVKTDILTRNGAVEYNHIIVMFYEELGQIVEIYGYNDISLDELKQVVVNLKLEPTGEVSYIPDIEPEEKKQGDEPESEAVTVINDANTVKVGESFDIGEGISCSVKNIELKDEVSELSKEFFTDFDGLISPYINEDGTIQDVELGQTVWENNAMVEKSEGSSPVKFAYITLDISNTSETDMLDQFVYSNIFYRNPETGEIENTEVLGDFWRAVGYEPVFYDGGDYLDGVYNKHLFASDFKAGETRTVHLGIFCAEKKLDQAYLSFRNQDEYTFVKLVP